MSYFTQYKLKDGRKIRGRYDSKSTKVCISRLDLEKLIYEADVAYEQAAQLQTIIENLAEIKRQSVTKAIDEIMNEIEQERVGYPPSADYYKAIMKCLHIIDKYKEGDNK